MANVHYPPSTYLSAFLAAKYLDISVFDLNRLVKENRIRTYTVDRYGEKFVVRELQALKESLQALKPGLPPAAPPAPAAETAEAPPGLAGMIDYDELATSCLAESREEEFCEVPRDHIGHIVNAALYYKTPSDAFGVYKSAGSFLSKNRIDEAKHPPLYLKRDDLLAGAGDIHTGIDQRLVECLAAGDEARVRKLLTELYANTLQHPVTNMITALKNSVDRVVGELAQRGSLAALPAVVAGQQSSVASHSVNIFFLALRFCYHNSYSLDNTREIVLSALLHDIGKARLPARLLVPGQALTGESLHLFRTHTVLGLRLLELCTFSSGIIKHGALEHHERLDGSGYPYGATKLSFFGQLIAIMDVYESLVSFGGSAGRPLTALEALKTIREAVVAGQFNKDLFQQFAYSLSQSSANKP
jgi:HD-GYP domain-containing protein (c-di-GMP phosphodiesterase class II)